LSDALAQTAVLLVRMRRRRCSATASINVRSGFSAIKANICAVDSSSGETLPPCGFGSKLPNSCQRWTYLPAEETLTPSSSAASCRDAPSMSTRFDRALLSHSNRALASSAPTWECRRFKSAGNRF
jgi:hypothetical protein